MSDLTSTYKPLEHVTPGDSEYKLGTDAGESSSKHAVFLLNIQVVKMFLVKHLYRYQQFGDFLEGWCL